MDEARRRRYEHATDWWLTGAALLFLVAYAWPVLDPSMPSTFARACAVANGVIWLAFGVDYVIRLMLAGDRFGFFRRHLLELVIVLLPLLRPLRALQIVFALARMNRRATLSFQGRTMTYVVGTVLLLGFTGAVAVLDAERGASEATISSFGDALWWVAATITTVGYGDTYPVTTEGRFVGVGLMFGGIALVGVVTGTLASWFVERLRTEPSTEPSTEG